MASNVLEVADLGVAFGDDQVLSGVSFSIAIAGITAIVGPNGSGKTTLLRALLGLLPYQGRVSWTPGISLGYVPQQFLVPPLLPITVTEFFLLKSGRLWRPEPAFIERLPHELALMGLPLSLLDRPLGSLSSGQLQRLMVSWAMIAHPDVLLFDEPTATVDVGFSDTVYQIMHHLTHERGTTILLVSHDMNVVRTHASRVLCINRSLVCQGAPQEVLTPEALRRLFGEGAMYRHPHGHPNPGDPPQQEH